MAWHRAAGLLPSGAGGLAHSDPRDLRRLRGDGRRVLTFAVSGPPKEIGIILGIAVLIDALLMRLMRIFCGRALLQPPRMECGKVSRSSTGRGSSHRLWLDPGA
jgi:hypothetical protein